MTGVQTCALPISRGSKFSKIEVKLFGPNYRGVVATESIEKDEIIISVPKEDMITLTMAKNTSIGKRITEAKVSLIYPNNSTLATYVLLEEKNPKTKWRYMLDSMPKSVDNFPIFFKKEEKDLLKGTQFLRNPLYHFTRFH